jgi:hypothetical protein
MLHFDFQYCILQDIIKCTLFFSLCLFLLLKTRRYNINIEIDREEFCKIIPHDFFLV